MDKEQNYNSLIASKKYQLGVEKGLSIKLCALQNNQPVQEDILDLQVDSKEFVTCDFRNLVTPVTKINQNLQTINHKFYNQVLSTQNNELRVKQPPNNLWRMQSLGQKNSQQFLGQRDNKKNQDQFEEEIIKQSSSSERNILKIKQKYNLKRSIDKDIDVINEVKEVLIKRELDYVQSDKHHLNFLYQKAQKFKQAEQRVLATQQAQGKKISVAQNQRDKNSKDQDLFKLASLKRQNRIQKRLDRLVQGLPVYTIDSSSITNKLSDEYSEKFDDQFFKLGEIKENTTQDKNSQKIIDQVKINLPFKFVKDQGKTHELNALNWTPQLNVQISTPQFNQDRFFDIRLRHNNFMKVKNSQQKKIINRIAMPKNMSDVQVVNNYGKQHFIILKNMEAKHRKIASQQELRKFQYVIEKDCKAKKIVSKQIDQLLTNLAPKKLSQLF